MQSAESSLNRTPAPRHITPAGSAAFHARAAHGSVRRFEHVSVSSVGWSTSRRDGVEDASVIVAAARLGVNVFDLVPYVRDAAAERAMGAALAEAGSPLTRSELLITTRVGFLSEPVLDFGLHVRMIEERYIAPSVFAWDELAYGNHTIAPELVRRSLEASARRLGTGIDVVFLASPARQLAIADQALVEQRLRRAFEVLEERALAGAIGSYGIVNPAGLQLQRLTELAREVGGARHHLRAVQFPLSLHLASRGLPRTQHVGSHALTLADAAQELGLYAFASSVISAGAAEYDVDADTRTALGGVASDEQLGLQWARSVPGIGTALVGMRRSAHLVENTRVLSLPDAPAEVVLSLLPEDEGDLSS